MKKGDIFQFIKFCIVGASNTIISQMVYFVFVYIGCHYILASLMGFILSVLNAFFWSNKYVFKQKPNEKRIWWKTLVKTYVAYAGGAIIGILLLVFWIDIVNISLFMGKLAILFQNAGWVRMDADMVGKIVASLLNLCITIPLNFVVNKYWAYRKNEKEKI